MALEFAFNEAVLVTKIVLAVVLGLLIGYERKSLKFGLGARTSMLICLGAALFTIAGTSAFDATNLARVAQGLAAGVGFIGAAVVWQNMKEGVVVGLTTAATIWLLTAIGFAVGAGLYIAAVAATIVTLIILFSKRFGIE